MNPNPKETAYRKALEDFLAALMIYRDMDTANKMLTLTERAIEAIQEAPAVVVDAARARVIESKKSNPENAKPLLAPAIVKK